MSSALAAPRVYDARPVARSSSRRWVALGLVCFGALMIVLDGTIVNIALPSIQRDLGFSQAGLAWVVNAYVLTFGGFLLLGGRAADLIGRRAVFIAGLAVFTAAPILAVYGILRASESGWGSPQVIVCLALAFVILAAFVVIEKKVRTPIVPLHVFRSAAISISNIVMVCMMAAFFGWFFFSPLYMQRVLGFDALQTGLGFLPAMLVFGAMSLGIAAKIVGRIGPKPALLAGMSLAVGTK